MAPSLKLGGLALRMPRRLLGLSIEHELSADPVSTFPDDILSSSRSEAVSGFAENPGRMGMSEIAFPAPDRDILKRRDAIVAGLRRVLPKDCVIDKLDERRA